MAKSMWRIRRATCAEKGSVRRRKVPDVYLRLKAQPITDAISIVQSAQSEIRTTGTLSPAAYTAVLPVIRNIQVPMARLHGESIPSDPKIDDQLLPLLERQGELLEMALEARHRMTEEEVEANQPVNALPPDSNDVFRYETAAQKKLDWAQQKLLESQQRRHKAQTPGSVKVSSDQ
jgi:hypothetical protein